MKKALKIIFNVLLWLIVIFALLITILVFSSTSNGGVSNLLGYIPMTIESQSMSPTFNEGDLIIAKQIDDPNELKVDDVISFWTLIDGHKVKNTHRIVRINKTENSVSFITRGDNNPIDDELPAYQSELIGKWTNIKFSGAGNIMAFLRTKLGFFVCILIPMAIFFLFELYKFIVTVIAVKRGEPEPQLDEEEIKRRAIEEYLAAQKAKEEEAKGDEKSADDKSEKKDEKPADDKSDKKDEKPADDKSDKKDEKPADDKSDKKDEKPADDKSDKKDEKPADDKSEKKDEKPAEKNSGKTDKKPTDK